MKLLWIDLNCSYSHSSLALPALHAQLMHRNGIEWEVVRTTIGEHPGVVASAISMCHPDVVAATAWLFTHEQLLHIVTRVKALLPQVTVILGGPEFLGDNENYMRSYPEVNCVLRGEGELSFSRWVDVWDTPSQWHIVEGLCYMYGGNYHDGGWARNMQFDAMKAPECSPFFVWNKPFVQLETTRGCFNTCAFCVSGAGDPVRLLDVDTIRQRLDHICERGIRDVRILDRTFNSNPSRAIALLELFETYHSKLRFHLEIHPALLPHAVRKVLASLPRGLLHLEAGIQSLRQEVLDCSLRKGSLQQTLDGLRFLCSLPNVATHADLIAGLPQYTLKQLYEDICTLVGYSVDELQIESLKLLPGTVMRHRAEEWGIRYSPLPPYEVLHTDSIDSVELQEARRLSRLIDAYYNTPAWQQITRRLILGEDTFLHHFLGYLTEHNYIDQPMSLERRGEILYQYCCDNYSQYVTDVTVAWVEAGMSLKKRPAEKVRTKRMKPPVKWEIIYGEYVPSLRLCFLPIDADHGLWFGYDTTSQCPTPIFKAWGKQESVG
ncbi:MAG: DUF4080 domain-containing protein [Bacteroidales bacterium]|nr:DUF4080 domain-containing protein [Bacteroidales bacterium]